jgi:hypothetical protein
MRRVAVITILIVAIGLGAAREYLFINLNYQIDHVGRATEFSYADSDFKAWTSGWSIRQLEMLKWAMALGYIVVMTLLAIGMARFQYGTTRYASTIALSVVLVSCLALALHLFSGWLPPLADVGVKLLHMLQYPVVLVVLLASRGLASVSGK